MEVIGFEENAEFLKFIWAQISDWHLVEFMLPGNVLCVWWLNKNKPVTPYMQHRAKQSCCSSSIEDASQHMCSLWVGAGVPDKIQST